MNITRGVNCKMRGSNHSLLRWGQAVIWLLCFGVWVIWCLVVDALGATDPRPFVSGIFGSNMVLQRGKTNMIWGWTDPGSVVTVSVANIICKCEADTTGRWVARFVPPAEEGPFTITIQGPQRVELTNVLVGDVWLCSGQSNMEFPLKHARNGEAAVAGANHPNLRFFIVGRQPAYTPVATVTGQWRVCSPTSVTADGGLSAVAYYFARKIQSETNVSIGLIQAAVGGSPAEAWTSAGALRELGEFVAELAEVERLHRLNAPAYGNYIMHWYDEYDVGQKENWFAPGFDDSSWQEVNVPGGFAELGVSNTPAVCYFRRKIVVPEQLAGRPATLRLGMIERMDTAYINGQWVGASAWVENPRVYHVQRGVIKPGTNVLVIRVFKVKPDGGFLSRAEDLRLEFAGGTVFQLAGRWRGRVAVDARPPHPLPLGFENWPVMPSVLYNGMIAPIAPLAISGVIWYQGEANVGRAAQYRRLLAAMILDWRRAFSQEPIPFYMVSLASFLPRRDTPGDDAWAELREAQAFVAQTVENAGLAVAIDLGDAGDIHPKDKKEVGERLALWALANYYGKPVTASGPVFARLERIPGALKLWFTNTAGGLVVRGERLGEFAVAGEDRKWYWAEARIDGDAVIVSSPMVPNPVAARYAWQANPVATLYNKAGLPAVPFRTDQW